MSIDIIGKLKAMNNGDFKLMDAKDVEYANEKINTMIDEDKKIDNIADAVDALIDILNKAPSLSYVDEDGFKEGQKKYWQAGDHMMLVFSFSSSASGKCDITITRNGLPFRSFKSNKGRIVVDLGVATSQKDNYKYKVTAIDSLGRDADQTLEFNHVIGGVDLSSTFNLTLQNSIFTVGTNTMEIPVNISYAESGYMRSINYDIKDPNNKSIKGNYECGTNNWSSTMHLENIEFTESGEYSISLQGQVNIDEEILYSNIISYNFAVIAENTIAISIIEFNNNNLTTNDSISIKFRTITNNSNLASPNMLISECKLYNNDDLIKNITITNITTGDEKIWNIGRLQDEGTYRYEIIGKPNGSLTDGINIQSISGEFNVIKTDDVGNNYIKDNLIAYFDANDMDNSQTNPDIWKAKNDNNYYFKLYGLNYEKNGWLIDDTDNSKMLKFTGDSYGELNHIVNNTITKFAPMSLMNNKGIEGNSFEIVYRTRCIGQMDACVISCRDESIINRAGYSIYYDEAKMSSDNVYTSTPITESDNEFVHVTFVIDKNIRDFKNEKINNDNIENINPVPTMNIYVNGVRTKVITINDDEIFNTEPMQLLLNSYLNKENNKITGFGSCEIKMIRIYSAPLTAQDVLNNYINSKNKIEDRKKLIAKNDSSQADIPIIHFVRNKTIDTNSDGTKTNVFGKYSKDNTFANLNSIKTKSSSDPNILTSKNTWVNCTMWYTYLDKESSKWKTVKYNDVDVYLQGTSTLQFPIKNYKIKAYKTKEDEQGNLIRDGKNKFIPPNKENEDGWLVPDSTYTLKCDFMEQSHKNNTPTAIMYEDILDKVIKSNGNINTSYSPCKRNDYINAYDEIKNENNEVIRTRRRYRDAINGFPVLLYYNENNTDEDYNDISEDNGYPDNTNDIMVGTMMFNIDKTGGALGFNPKFKDFKNIESDKINEDGKIYVKNPITGEPVKYTDKTDVLLDTIPCISLEGSSNASIPVAASFYTMDEANKYLYEDYLEKKYKGKQNNESYSNDYNTFYNEVQQKQYTDIYTFDEYKDPENPDTEKYTNVYDYIKSTFDIRWAWTEESLESGKELSDDDFNQCTYGHIVKALEWIDESYNNKEKFKNEFNTYFNYEYCSTYFLQMMMFIQVDNAGKNAMFDKWFDDDIIGCGGIRPRPYDMDTQVGLNNSGGDTINISAEISPILSPTGITGSYKDSAKVSNINTDKNHIRYNDYNTKNSKFWNAFATYFKMELIRDYTQLRESYYDINWINDTVNSITSDIIGESFYNKDAGAKYMSQTYYKNDGSIESSMLIRLNGNRDNRYRQVMQQRMIFTDTWFGYTGENSLNSSISLRSHAPDMKITSVQIGISVYSPCYVRIDIASGSDAVIIAYIDPNERYEYGSDIYEGVLFTMPIASSDKEITIHAAGNIKSINHMENLYLSRFDCGNAKKLTSINISSSISLHTLTTGANTYLRNLNVSNSTNLEGQIDLSKCENIQEINISNTNITTIQIPEGSALKKFNAKNCKLTNIEFKDLQFLNDINLNGCNNISSYTINNCPSIKEIDTTQYSNLKEIEINQCNNLSKLNLSYSNINTLSITNCDNIKSINLSHARGAINDINLTTLYNLQEINITSYNPPNDIIIRLPVFNDKKYTLMTENEREDYINSGKNIYYNSLTTFIANESNLKTVMRGSSEVTNTCDFNNLTLKNMNIKKCKKITSIENLNFIGDDASELFKELDNLGNISGSITSDTDTITGIFFGCLNLSTIKNLKLSLNKVTNANDCFRRCEKINYASIKKLLESIPNVTTIDRFLYMDAGTNNASIKTLGSELFTNNTKIRSMEYAFYHTNIETVENILDPMESTLFDIKGIFRNCTKLNSVNNNIFKYCYNLSDCSEAFYSCTSLTTLFTSTYDIFAENNNIVTTQMMFGKCAALSKNENYDTEDENGLKLMFDHLPKLEYAEGMFRECTFITGIPTGLFEKNTKLCNICAMFQYNTNLKSIPDTLFNINTNTEPTNETTHPDLTMARGLFSDCINLEGRINSNFFDGAFNIKNIGHINNLKISNITPTIYAGGMFANTGINGYNAEFLNKLIHLESVSMLFFKGSINIKTENGNSVINIIPSKDGNNNRKLINTYIGNSYISNKICNSIFSKLTKLKDVRYCFAGNVNMTGFCNGYGDNISDPTLFYNCKETLENAEGLFARTGLACSVPNTLFKNCNSLKTLRACYADCLLSGTLPNDFIEGCTSLMYTDYMFYNCNDLGSGDDNLSVSIPVDIFKNCTNLIDASYMFAGCGFNGRIGTGNKNNPGGLLTKCLSLIATEGMFAGCTNLKGSIPEDIFYTEDNMKIFNNLQNISHMFDTCTNLTSNSTNGAVFGHNNSTIYAEQDGNKYLIPSDWFGKCNNITNMSYIFNHVSNPNSTPSGFEFKKIMIINNNTFSNQRNLQNIEYAFAHVKSLSCEINNDFMKNSLNAITNASYIFAFSNIKSVGNEENKAIFETGNASQRNNKMQNMEGLLYNAYNNNMNGYAPSIKNFTKLENTSSMVYDQTKLNNYNSYSDNQKALSSYNDADGTYNSNEYNIIANID